MQIRYSILLIFIVYGSSLFFRWEANTTLVETIREQNDEQFIERTYYDYDVEQVMFTYPDNEIQVDVRWRIDPGTITSVDINNRNIWLCSSIARKNIQQVVDVPYYIWFSANNAYISQHDAVWLIQQWSQKLLHFENDELLLYLTDIHDTYRYTVADVYAYKPNGILSNQVQYTAYEDPLYQKYIQQWHRVMAFLWTDNQRYVLDPLRGEKNIEPQLLDVYVKWEEFSDWTWLVPTYAYMPWSHIYTHTPSSFVSNSYKQKHISRVNISQTPMHYFPSDRSEIIGSLDRWTALEVLDTFDDWTKVKNYDWTEWWVSWKYIEIETYTFEKKDDELLPEIVDNYVQYISYLHTII